MNVEVVEFYPLTRDETRGVLTGTLRVKILDFGLHILGVFVSKKNDSYFFALPGKKTTHSETNETCRYPFVVFEDRERQQLLMEAIREKGRNYIEKRLSDTANPLAIPKTYSRASESQKTITEPKTWIEQQKRDTCDLMQKKTPPPAADLTKIASVQWSDPPARKKPQTKRSYKNAR